MTVLYRVIDNKDNGIMLECESYSIFLNKCRRMLKDTRYFDFMNKSRYTADYMSQRELLEALEQRMNVTVKYVYRNDDSDSFERKFKELTAGLSQKETDELIRLVETRIKSKEKAKREERRRCQEREI